MSVKKVEMVPEDRFSARAFRDRPAIAAEGRWVSVSNQKHWRTAWARRQGKPVAPAL